MSVVRTRFAPSPTGNPDSVHLGFVIRALWNYAYAKKNHGQFVLRIEDTDIKRSRKDTEEAIYTVLKKFGITWDEGPDVGGPHEPYRQSERLDRYQKAAHLLVERGFAYYDFDAEKREKDEIKASYEEEEMQKTLKVRPDARQMDPKEALARVKKGEPFVVRAKIPENKVFEYIDWILKKKIRFFGKEVSDMILLKSDGYPTYHLAVVVDDNDMQISHVFRGQEWISSTPIHLHVYEGLEFLVPEIGHFSVILDPRTGKKFSKRDMTAMFGVDKWLADGYLPDAILNYLMLLGWAPKDNREIFSLSEFVEAFDQDGVQKANPTFDVKKLNWFNQQYLQKIPKKDFISYASGASVYNGEANFTQVASGTASFMPSRITNIRDYDRLMKPFFEDIVADNSLFTSNKEIHLKIALEVIENCDPFTLENLNDHLMTKVKENNFNTGDFFMDLRVAIMGSRFTPPINESVLNLGKSEVTKRIKRYI